MDVFWDIAPCSLVEVHRLFRGACCLHHHGRSLRIMSYDVIAEEYPQLSSHVTSLSIRHVSIVDCRKSNGTGLELPPIAKPPYKISWKSVQPFLSCYVRTDGRTNGTSWRSARMPRTGL
jgi:hypothetical protein